MERLPGALSRVQGWYYLIVGVWGLFSPRTLQQVTGLNHEFWLTQTFALQLTIVGAILLLAAKARRLTWELALLALGEALLLGIVDLYRIGLPRSTSAYIVDALAELGLAIGWLVALYHERSRRSHNDGLVE